MDEKAIAQIEQWLKALFFCSESPDDYSLFATLEKEMMRNTKMKATHFVQ
jgi:hypothetical protein